MVRKIRKNEPHVNIGTIGHIDHGRPRSHPPLPVALPTRVANWIPFDQIDKPEEKEGALRYHATWNMRPANRHYAHVDCPATQTT